jgi:MFS transporter, DHA2 family, methylenomycin A resistance protein
MSGSTPTQAEASVIVQTRQTQATAASTTATLVATSLGFGVVQLDVTVVNVAVKQIGSSLGGGVSQLQWVVSAYTLVFAALILTAGALGDRIGAKRVFAAGFAVFVVASMACGLAPNLAVLIGARAVQGVGAAVLTSCSLALLNHAFHDAGQRARAVGLWAAGASAALSAGPVVGGVLVATLGWRSIFFINLPIGLTGMWLAVRHAEETPRSGERGVDVAGQLAAVLALAALAWAMIQGGALGFTNPWVLAGFAIFVLAGGGFWLLEARARQPMLPLSLVARRAVAGPTLVGLLVNIAFYGLIFVFSLLFQRGQGLSALRTGLAFLPMTAAIMAANLTAGRLSGAVSARQLVLLGLTVMLAGCFGLLWIQRSTPYLAMAAQLVALGWGLGLLVPPMTSTLLGSVDRARSGVASGTLTTMRQSGSVVGVSLFGSLIAGNGRLLPGVHLALVISIGLLLLAGLCTAMIAAQHQP